MNQLHTSQITLQSFGYLLQRIHFAKYMEGYHIYLLQDGTISSQSLHPIARVTLTNEKMTLLSLRDNLSVGPNLLNKDDTLLLDTSLSIIYNNVHFLFIPHPQNPVSGWPYRAEIQTKATPINISFNNKSLIRIGRKSSCEIVLPSHSKNDNIIWKPEFEFKDSVPTGAGYTSKSRFSTDTIMVSTEHAGVRHENGLFVLQNIGKNCSCFIRRDDSIFALTPPQDSDKAEAREDITLQNNDLLYIGNRLFRVQMNAQRNEPHLDPSRFIHEAFPTHMDAPSRSTQTIEHNEVESLAAQAKRFFAPKSSSNSEQVSDVPETPKVHSFSESEKSNIEQHATTLSSQAKRNKERPSNRHTPLSPQQMLQSAKTINLIEPTDSETNANPPVDIPEYIWELSLSSSHQIRLLGWLIKGSLRIGNTADHDIIIPENRIQSSQVFQPQDYCTLHFRRGTNAFTSHDSSDIIIEPSKDNEASETRFHIVRRGLHGSEDFRITLEPQTSSVIPSSMNLSIDRGDETVASMFTQSLTSNSKLIPFRFSSTDINCSVEDDDLIVEATQELRMVRVDLNGNVHTHGREKPMRISPNEKAIIENCIIQWYLPN
ncbi:MAG: hypothetical protein ACON4U_17170 [Myxococcota bacterium]